MSLINRLFRQITGQSRLDRARRRRPFSPFGPQAAQVETLECRTLLTAYAAATTAQLVADINAANKAGGDNTITLTSQATSPYDLAGVSNSVGGTLLPVIKKGDNLTIVTGNGSASPGFGDTIDAAQFGRIFDIASGASLTLENVTLQNGMARSAGAAVDGGAIYNQGTLVLSSVLVQENTALGHAGTVQHNKVGGAGQDAAGGGVWSDGSLTVENGTVFQDNTALGGGCAITSAGTGLGGKAFGGAIDIAGGTADITGTTFGAVSLAFGNTAQGGAGNNTASNLGGAAYGGAVYVAAGTVVMDVDTVGSAQLALLGYQTQNVAQGGADLPGNVGTGNAYGGGLYVAGGTVTLLNDIVEGNVAGTPFGGTSVTYLDGYGGGIFIASGATVSIDSCTGYNTNYNSDSSGIYFGNTANIDGTYILLSC